jgi:zinc protease
MRVKCLAVFLFAWLALSGTRAYALEVSREVLPSGLTVLHAERHNLPLVMLTLLVKAGMKDELAEESGLANLTASLLTEGTKSRTSIQLSDEKDYIGAGLGVSASDDYTTVSLSVLKKDIEKGFELFSDILLNPVFPPEEINRLRELIKGSLKRSEESPSFVATKRFEEEVYGDHPYGRLASGTVEGLDRIEREDILEFYSRYFVPNNSILTVVGDISREELDSLIARRLKDWQKAEVPARGTSPMPEKGLKVVAIDKDLMQANIILGHLGISRDNPDYYAFAVMNFILGGGGFSSRLMDTLRDRMGLTYGVYSSVPTGLEPGLFKVEVQTKNESASTVVEEILKEIRGIREEGVTEEELSDAKAYLSGSFPRRLDTMSKIVWFLSTVEFHGLGLDYMEKFPDYINAVTRDDVKRVARKYLDPENYVLVIVARLSEADIEDLSRQ